MLEPNEIEPVDQEPETGNEIEKRLTRTGGVELDRDINAAINILRLGRSRWALTSAAAGVAQEAAGL